MAFLALGIGLAYIGTAVGTGLGVGWYERRRGKQIYENAWNRLNRGDRAEDVFGELQWVYNAMEWQVWNQVFETGEPTLVQFAKDKGWDFDANLRAMLKDNEEKQAQAWSDFKESVPPFRFFMIPLQPDR